MAFAWLPLLARAEKRAAWIKEIFSGWSPRQSMSPDSDLDKQRHERPGEPQIPAMSHRACRNRQFRHRSAFLLAVRKRRIHAKRQATLAGSFNTSCMPRRLIAPTAARHSDHLQTLQTAVHRASNRRSHPSTGSPEHSSLAERIKRRNAALRGKQLKAGCALAAGQTSVWQLRYGTIITSATTRPR